MDEELNALTTMLICQKKILIITEWTDPGSIKPIERLTGRLKRINLMPNILVRQDFALTVSFGKTGTPSQDAQTRGSLSPWTNIS